LPRRSRAAAITGAACGVDAVASSAFPPFHPGVAAGGGLLGVAIGSDETVVQVQPGDLLRTGQDRRLPGQPRQKPGGHRVELADMAEAEGA
jgi:hypothetical protein